MPKVYCQVRDLAYKGELTHDQKDELRKCSAKITVAANSHEVISSAYSDFLSILKQHDVTVQK